jgi:acyl-CoA reductase-like NAD-dependent aldehyde dehydrogenase
MEEILQFIAVETTKTKDGYQTIMTFTEAAIDLIKETYIVDQEQVEDLTSATIEQNADVWDNLETEEREAIMEDIVDQIACESFTVDEMGIDDYISITYTSTLNGEVQIIVLTEEPIPFI